jgi:hypothetical protein
MLIDCDSCSVRGRGCGDCVVTVLLGAPPDDVYLEPEEQAALDVLAAFGMVPPLRLVMAADAGWSDADADTPIPYGIAYRQPYGPGRLQAEGAADAG